MRLIVSVLIVTFLFSCGRKSANQTNDINSIKVIDFLSIPKTEIKSLSDFALDIEYIPLETNERSLIGSLNKVVVNNNIIYIKDNNKILSFNEKGEFLCKLDKQGRGPEEFNYLTDFDVSSDNKTLIILTGMPRKIMEFNNTGTEFVFRKSFNILGPNPSRIGLIPYSNNILLSIDPLSGSETSLSILLNLNGDTLLFKPNCYNYDKKKGNENFVVHVWESLQYKFGNSVYFREQFSDTIFCVNSKSLDFEPALILDSRGTIIPPQAKGDRNYFKEHPGKYSFVFTIMEVPRYIIYLYEYDLKKYRTVYDKSTSKRYSIALIDALIDDLSGGPNFDPAFCCQDKFYSSINALNLKRHVDSEDFAKLKVQNQKKKEELKKLANSIEESDNPVLVVVTPKN